MAKAKRLAILNEKGGSGKTTTAVNMAAVLAQRGARVLLVDLDPQGNATASVGLTKVLHAKEGYGTADFVLGEGAFAPVRAALELTALDVVPAMKVSSPLLEMKLVENQFGGNQKLRNAVTRVDTDYDWVLVDCPPNLGMLAINAVAACRNVLVPVELAPLAALGAVSLRTFVGRVKSDLEHDARIVGVLGTFNQKTNVRRDALEAIRQLFGAAVFNTVIDEATAIRAASGTGRPIVLADPSHKGSEQYVELVKEVIARANY